MSTAQDDRSLAELEEERDSLLHSLEGLEREKASGEISEEDYAALKDDYTGRTATVLKAIDEARHRRPSDVSAPARPAATPATPWWRSRRSVLVGAGIVVFALVVGVLLARAVGDRLDSDPVTGAVTPTGTSDDLARARQLIGDNNTVEALKVYDAILRRDPRQPEALAYRGWLVRLAGRQSGNAELVDVGLGYVNRAVEADPGYPDAHLFRGLILYQDKGDPAGAIPELRAFLASNPPRELLPMVEDVLRRAEADAGQAPPAGAPPPAPAAPAPPIG